MGLHESSNPASRSGWKRDTRSTNDEPAAGSGASPRTLARLFRGETGMTLSQWRTRLRLVESIERLARGASVSDVAKDLGDCSTSSFVYMFRSTWASRRGPTAAACSPAGRGVIPEACSFVDRARIAESGGQSLIREPSLPWQRPETSPPRRW